MSELVSNLRKAAVLLKKNNTSCVFSVAFESSKDFAIALEDLATLIERTNKNPLLLPYVIYRRFKARIWFAPTSDWDDYASLEGEELGNAIFKDL